MLETVSKGFELLDSRDIGAFVKLWRAIQDDPTMAANFPDTFPKHLEDFWHPVQEGTMRIWLLTVEGEIAGAQWIHDWGLMGRKDACWTGAYRTPAFRNRLGIAPMLAMNHLIQEEMGIPHIYCGMRTQNEASKKAAYKIGYHYVGEYPEFNSFEGQLEPVALYSMRGDDHDLLWQLAACRAQQNRARLRSLTHELVS